LQQSSSNNIVIEARNDHYCGRFTAMASPCELLIETADKKLAQHLCLLAFNETKRIEDKFSRYRNDNLLYKINHAKGHATKIDDETYRLLTFADTCFELSDGMFDLSSGVLRKVWKFEGSDQLPTKQQVTSLLPLIGWKKVQFNSETVTLPTDMELDLGGIGKEYAVDCVAKLCQLNAPHTSVVVNFGGDIQVTQPRKQNRDWHIGIESLEDSQSAVKLLQIKSGGLATSGDARRYLLKDGQRYSHILNPKTGYPVINAPRSVTVAAPHCIQAGLLATLALLHGQQAEAFLQQQNLQFWCYR